MKVGDRVRTERAEGGSGYIDDGSVIGTNGSLLLILLDSWGPIPVVVAEDRVRKIAPMLDNDEWR